MIYYFENKYILGGLVLLFFVLAGILKVKMKKSNMYLLCFLIMYIYLCEVINLTQFPIYASEGMKEAMGSQNVWREMNLIPFKTIADHFSKDIILNILMTLPLGFGLPFLMKCSWGKITFSGLILGVLCESGQLESALWAGFTFRNVNIDDVILNLLGTLIGYFIFKIFSRIFRWGYRKLKIKSNVILTYILKACDENAKVSR